MATNATRAMDAPSSVLPLFGGKKAKMFVGAGLLSAGIAGPAAAAEKSADDTISLSAKETGSTKKRQPEELKNNARYLIQELAKRCAKGDLDSKDTKTLCFEAIQLGKETQPHVRNAKMKLQLQEAIRQAETALEKSLNWQEKNITYNPNFNPTAALYSALMLALFISLLVLMT